MSRSESQQAGSDRSATDQPSQQAAEGDSGSRQTASGSSGDSPQGSTNIAPQVVQQIAALAAGEVSGIHAMGSGVSRSVGALRERIPGSGSARTSGVQVEVGQRQAAIDLDVIVEYGAPMVELTRSVRNNVINSVERMTGLDVIEVNIAVNDVHLSSEDSSGETTVQSRVQ